MKAEKAARQKARRALWRKLMPFYRNRLTVRKMIDREFSKKRDTH